MVTRRLAGFTLHVAGWLLLTTILGAVANSTAYGRDDSVGRSQIPNRVAAPSRDVSSTPARETNQSDTASAPKSSGHGWRSWFSCRAWADRCTQGKTTVGGWATRRPGPCYGLDGRALERRSHESPDVVIIVHGLNSRPEDFASLHRSLTAVGHEWYDFRYPNDQRIEDSAQQLSMGLRELARERPWVRVHLIAHSMGGLVARRVIEDPSLDSGTVQRLIMIAVPNHGSDLAMTRCPALDLWEFLTSDSRRKEAGWLTGSIQDGWCDAVVDLRPGSEFLRSLNQRPRNPCVAYSLLVGNGGAHFVSPAAQRVPSQTRVRWWSRCMQQTRRCVDKTVCATSPWAELRIGFGDGAVAVQRAILHDVEDVVIDGSSHATLNCDPRIDPSAAQLHQAILRRLPPPTREVDFSR